MSIYFLRTLFSDNRKPLSHDEIKEAKYISNNIQERIRIIKEDISIFSQQNEKQSNIQYLIVKIFNISNELKLNIDEFNLIDKNIKKLSDKFEEIEMDVN